MPGIVVFRRRWSVGSDDLVVPGVFLFTMHAIWIIVLGVLLGVVEFDRSFFCVKLLWEYVLGYLAILGFALANELAISVVAMRGSVLDTSPRASMQYLLYIRVVILITEAGWLIAGIVWLANFYIDCPIERAKETLLGLVVCNGCILVSVLVTVWCTYDSAGRSWVKMKQYQRSMRESESKFQYRRSGSTRNWRQRKVLRAYQDSWDQRCRLLFCCMSPSDRHQNSFADIARLLSDFFRGLDVVPSDVITGLILLRKFQKIERKAIVEQSRNDTYEFLSGVAITPRTQFLSLREGEDLELFQTVIHFAWYAVRVYGWPLYVMRDTMGMCKLCPNLKCCCCIPCQKADAAEIIDDNCCKCNYATLQKLSDIGNIEIIYATYHVDVGETPFFVAIDYDRRKVVIGVRGTLSMKDVLTDLNAEAETLPLDPPREDWLGHKGMVQAAQYILEKIKAEQLLEKAFAHAPDKGTHDFKLVLVGHSLGAGIACILGILLRQEYPDLLCYCYSPPGGLLSMPAVEYTKSFTISVVMGKDVVPRIGLHQMEALRADLINAIKRSVDPKWKTITCSVVCCGCGTEPTSATELSATDSNIAEYMASRNQARIVGLHPSDSSIALTSHQPLYPPGRIIHVVRHHPTKGEQALSKHEPVYQALWAQNTDFDEVLISPVMIQDHMPYDVLTALNKVVTTLGPRKPQRTNNNYNFSEDHDLVGQYSPPPTHRLYFETSFTSLQSPSAAPSAASSITNGNYRVHPSPLPLTRVLSVFDEKSASTPAIASKSLNLQFDLIHDDWFGLAPLASPESMSEISSISSRASLVDKIQLNEYELKTPTVMRRTPKIHGNLSTCADDIKSVRHFQKLGLARYPQNLSQNGSSFTNSSSNLSYESAVSKDHQTTKCQVEVNMTSGESDDFQSAEDILDHVMVTAGCAEFFNSKSTVLETAFDETMFENFDRTIPEFLFTPDQTVSPQLCSPSTPQEVDPDVISNFAIDLNLDEEHRSLQFTQRSVDSKPNSVDSGSMCRTPSDITKNVTFNPQVINIDCGFISVPSPERKRKKSGGRWNLLSLKNKSSKFKRDAPKVIKAQQVPKTILSSKRRNSSDECFSRTEALPLLSGLGGNNERTSPNFVRRKKYVYPTITIISKDESSV